MSDSELTFAEFKAAASEIPSYARPGQHAFNVLYEVRPDLADRIRGDHLNLDPFHQSANLPAFWAWVEANWIPGEEA